MTTVAWDGITLAADRQMSLFRGSTTKIHRLVDGRLYGACGQLQDAVAVKEWLEKGGEKPKVTDNFHAIIVDQSMCYSMEDKLVLLPRDRPMFAVGSGRDFAMAAMLLGKTAAEAILIAHQLDTDTGPQVDELQVHTSAHNPLARPQ